MYSDSSLRSEWQDQKKEDVYYDTPSFILGSKQFPTYLDEEYRQYQNNNRLNESRTFAGEIIGTNVISCNTKYRRYQSQWKPYDTIQ